MYSKTWTAIEELARRALLKLRRQDIIVEGSCKMCGECCKSLNFTSGGEWVHTVRQFEELKKKYPEYEIFEPVGRSTGGVLKFRCKMLGPDNLCTIHDDRPDFCRDYPEEDMFLMGGDVLACCGYSFKTVPSFKRILDEQMKKGNEE